MENTAWPMNDIISKLCEATNILLHEKNYDGHGYEEMQLCLTLAQKHLADRASEVGVQPEVSFAEPNQQSEQMMCKNCSYKNTCTMLTAFLSERSSMKHMPPIDREDVKCFYCCEFVSDSEARSN